MQRKFHNLKSVYQKWGKLKINELHCTTKDRKIKQEDIKKGGNNKE